jgi:hypothetical protein
MAALEADDDIGLFRQPIDDLPFTFVPPLGADHDHICHEVSFPADADANVPLPKFANLHSILCREARNRDTGKIMILVWFFGFDAFLRTRVKQ